eukprot:jgi/Galph1/1216/GphlegSOOS_G5932.1
MRLSWIHTVPYCFPCHVSNRARRQGKIKRCSQFTRWFGYRTVGKCCRVPPLVSAAVTNRLSISRVQNGGVTQHSLEKDDCFSKEEYEWLRNESLKEIDWFLVCKKVATFAQTEKAIAFIKSGMNVTEITRKQTGDYLLEVLDCTRWLKSSATVVSLNGCYEVEQSVELARRGRMLSPVELYKIASTCQVMRKLKRELGNSKDMYPRLCSITEGIHNLTDLEQCVFSCIDEGGEVLDTASPALLQVRTQIRDTINNIKKSLNSSLREYEEYLQDYTWTERFGRFVIPVKSVTRDKVPGIVQDVSSSGSTVYIEPSCIRHLSNRLQQLRNIEAETIEEILRQLSENVSNEALAIMDISKALLRMDIILAKAQYSADINGKFPQLFDLFAYKDSSDTKWNLKGIRHPLLLERGKESASDVVPIDFLIRPGIAAVCITGPNTGGKTVALKTLGLVSLMAKAGLFIPSEHEEVSMPYFEDILTDIGDHQSVIDSLSTFSSHVLRLRRIIHAAHSRCLILLDEIGTGTDPKEGSALGKAVLRYLVDHVGFLVATTHHEELKILKYKDSRFENASVEFDNNLLAPTYRLLWGVAGRSNALLIAERLGIPSTILNEAKILLEKSTNDVSSIIEDVEKLRMENIYMKEDLQRIQEVLNKREKQLDERERRCGEHERELQEKKKLALMTELEMARKEIGKVVKEIQQYGSDAFYVTKKRQELESFVANKMNSEYSNTQLETFQVGDMVQVEHLGSEPLKVVETENSKGELTVLLGSIRVKVRINEARKVPKKENTTRKKSFSKSSPGYVESSHQVHRRVKANTLDVRGCRLDDAIAKIENELGRSMEHNAYFIIHGYGTLRKGILQYLTKHHLVKRTEDANIADGGQGVTIVYLKY